LLWSTGHTTQAIIVRPTAGTTYGLTVWDGFGCSSYNETRVDMRADDPPTESVPNLRLVKDTGGGLRISFDDIGAHGYNLHRAGTPWKLPGAPAADHLVGLGEFVDSPTEDRVYYAVRGASECSQTSGP
jgi:hypothetical protein